MRYVIALAAIPLLTFGVVAVSRPTPPIVPVRVLTEGVRMIRMDATTFRSRWLPVISLQPAYAWDEPAWITAYRHAALPATVKDAGGRPVELARGGDANPTPQGPVVVARSPPARHVVKRAALRGDICSRHRMRKVMVGKYRWRCRR